MIKSSFSYHHSLSFHCWRHVSSLTLWLPKKNLHVGKHPHFPFCCALALGVELWSTGALFVCLFGKGNHLGTEAWSGSLAFPEIHALWGRHLTTLAVAFIYYHEHDSCSWCSTSVDTEILSFTLKVVSDFLLKGLSKTIILKCLPLVLIVTTL